MSRASPGEIWYLVEFPGPGNQGGDGCGVFLHSRISDAEWWCIKPDRSPLRMNLRNSRISSTRKDDVTWTDFPPMSETESRAVDLMIADLNNDAAGPAAAAAARSLVDVPTAMVSAMMRMIEIKWKTQAMMLMTMPAIILPEPSLFVFGPQQQMMELPIVERMPARALMGPAGQMPKPTMVTIAKPSVVPAMHLAEFTSGRSSGLLPHMRVLVWLGAKLLTL